MPADAPSLDSVASTATTVTTPITQDPTTNLGTTLSDDTLSRVDYSPETLDSAPEAATNENHSVSTGTQHRGFYGTLGAGGTQAGSVEGFALTAGLGFRFGPLLVTANAADVTLSSGDSGPYYRDEFSNGQSRCRNGDNGQFAEDSKCIAIDADYAASADLNIILPGTPLFIGGGGRVGGDSNLFYGSVGASWGKSTSRMWVLRGNLGKD